ncbi:MAG: alpha/beta hydrolase-fold protein, partial [Bacteroidales bacterium]
MRKTGLILIITLIIATPLCSQLAEIPDTIEILTCSDPFSVSGTTELVSIHGSGLEGNLLGDSPDRAASVYLPPGYENSPENRYPVLYFLHGYTSSHLSFFGGSSAFPDLDFSKIMDKLINSGAVPPVIIVSPNVNNKYGGCFYTNSYVTGQWEDFIARDVIDFVESNYRVISKRESRGIAGHSMGGYGTITLAMKHPELFSSAYTLSAALMDLEEYVFGQEIKEEKYLDEAVNGMRFEDLSFYARTYVAIAAAFAPDSTASPFLGRLPLDTSGAIIDSVWQKWLDHDPSWMLPTYRDNLMEYTAIQMDCGTSDQYYFYAHNESFSDSLTRYGIEHVFEGYEGDHVNRLANRIETRLLPFFFENLEHEVPGIIRTGAWNLEPSDSLVLEMDLDGTIYIVPAATGAVLDSILEHQILAVQAVAKSRVKIPLTNCEYDSYVAYGMNETHSGISLPVPFSVVPFIPEITIHLTDFSTKDPMVEHEVIINGYTYFTDSLGEVVFKGCGSSNSYALSIRRVENYAPLEKSLEVDTDTSFEFSLVRDSYLKIVDRATKLPIQGALVKFGEFSLFTNKNGVVTIQDLRSEDLNYRVEHTYYFPLVDTSALSSGDTLVVEMSNLLASVEFQVSDIAGPVPNQEVNLGGRTVKTNDDGIARFAVNQARQFYHYTIEKSCYSLVNDSLFLEVDTTVSVTLLPDTTLPEINTWYHGDTLEISSSSSGAFYVVPVGTERLLDSIKSDPLFTLPVLMNDPVQVNTSELPAGEYWAYYIDQCENVSEELTGGVGLEEVHAGDFNIYPNPVGSELFILYSGYGEYVVEITGLNGQQRYSQVFQGPMHQIHLSSFQKGVYFITIRSKDFV